MLHDRKVVGDEQVRQAVLVLQIFKHIDDLCLNGNIQRRDGLVADDKLRVHSQSAGDADALALAAGEFVRIAVGMLGVQAHTLQHFNNALPAVRLGGRKLVDVDGLAHDVAHRHAGVQAGIGVLEHDLHLAAVRQHVHGRLFAEFRLAAFVQHRGSVLVVQRHISAVKQRFAVIEDTAFRRLVQAQQRAARGGFSAAGFAHQPQCLALVDGE